MRKFILTVLVLIITTSAITNQCTDYDMVNTNTESTNSYNKELHRFMNAIALLESSGNYQARRRNSQYLGRYQIGTAARIDIGMSHISVNTFLQDSSLQDSAMKLLLKANYTRLEPYILLYDGSRIGHYYVTTSGILAMAHSAGASAVERFFQTGGQYIPKDGNGVPMVHYLQFNNFNFNLN